MDQFITVDTLANRISDAAGLLSVAEEGFHKLAVMTDAISALVDDPEIGRGLARIAHEIADDLAITFEGRVREYNYECRRISDAEHSSRGKA